MGEYLLFVLVLGSFVWLGIVVLKSNPSNPSNKAFALLIASLSIWMICNFFEGEVESGKLLLTLFRVDFASASLAAYFFLRLCIFFPVPSLIRPQLKVIVLPIIFLFAASFTPLIVEKVTIGYNENQPSFTFGPFFWIYAPVVGGYVFWATIIMLIKRANLKGLSQVQATYVLLGMGVSGTSAVVVNLFFASFFEVSVTAARLGIYSMLFLTAFTSYAMLRYRMLNIRIFVRENVSYIVTAGTIGTVLAIIAAFITRDINLSIFSFVVCFAVPYFQQSANRWVEKLSIKRGIINPNRLQAIESLADKIKDSGYKINDLAQTVVQITIDEFPVDKCCMLVMDYDTRTYNIEARYGLNKMFFQPILRNDPLILFLHERREIIVKSELERQLPAEKFASVATTFESLNAEVCVPLVVLDQVGGFIAIGPKHDQKPFFVNEIKQLKAIADETATALRYVLAVSRAAKETIKWAHTLNQSLKPLTAGFDFLVRRAKQQGTDPRLERVVPNIEATMKKLGEFLRFLLQDSRIADEALRDQYELSPISICDLVNDALGSSEISLKERKITLVNDLQKHGSNKILGHYRDLKSVFETLVSNALRYIPEHGTIEIKGNQLGETYRITVFNNGELIPEININNIFEEGFQINNGKQGMAGLGLYNAKRILHMHKGNISVENSGEPQGVRFILDLPLVEENALTEARSQKGLMG